MRAVLDYCTGATRREVPAGTFVLHEGSKTDICSCCSKDGWRSSRAIASLPF